MRQPDAWHDPSTDGRGFFINVFPQIEQMFVGWFTYDIERPSENQSAILGEPGHRWLTIEFASCNKALIRYEIASLGLFGEIPITCIVPDNIALCQALAGQ